MSAGLLYEGDAPVEKTLAEQSNMLEKLFPDSWSDTGGSVLLCAEKIKKSDPVVQS